MYRPANRIQPWPLLLAVVFCVFAQPGRATTVADPGRFLDQTESLRTTDHPRFVELLAQIHRESPPLTMAEQWRLRYLDAWESMYEGDYAKSAGELREIMARSGDKVLAIKASALLMSNLSINQHYTEAFELANQLTRALPEVKDAEARFTLLNFLSLTMDSAGQTELAMQYARMMESALPAGETLCKPLTLQIDVLDDSKRLHSSSPELQRAIATCVAARQPVYANSMLLVQGGLYLEEKQPAKAMALFDRIAQGIRVSGYRPQLLWLLRGKAVAYSALGNDGASRKAALAVLALSRPEDKGWVQSEVYKLLYQIEKKQGDAAAALGYYEKYAVMDRAYLDDVNARALAYETVQQHVLAQKLETEQLGRQNTALRMQQALAAKAAEANRLYLVLLLLALGFGAFWMYRLKRSQLRFKQLSHLDGLTTIFNRQHFMGEAERALHVLEKQHGAACLAFIDLDHFKRINDTHGHATGDEVLRQVTAACQQQLRPADLFGRLGGEEFAILLVACSREQGMAIAERIRQTIEASSVQSDGLAVSVSASLGLAFTDTCRHDLQRLCMEADAALYRAKRGGRNRVVDDVAAAAGFEI